MTFINNTFYYNYLFDEYLFYVYLSSYLKQYKTKLQTYRKKCDVRKIFPHPSVAQTVRALNMIFIGKPALNGALYPKGVKKKSIAHNLSSTDMDIVT